ncbi:hypothetical protein [Vitiosangium sp. GDMCC 1.1324]|uniref:hypothetical protein n=1 Tax=Vitiosangium sp. (strain GDMCC 1.1324) TaxID=2138576 RepID=UPI000D3A098A|nr:hypothetical protein [Vitiosangium sp. GDMCC 1.1324]PTL76600.1 hypothetical protein DAT35_49210 [Vitiosangium sp. GDMCC 1.1324]
MRKTLSLLLCLLSAGCVTTTKATYGTVPKERATECVAHCADLDMKLTAVVIISNSAGCVCQPKDAEQNASIVGAAAAAGGAISATEQTRQSYKHP